MRYISIVAFRPAQISKQQPEQPEATVKSLNKICKMRTFDALDLILLSQGIDKYRAISQHASSGEHCSGVEIRP
jgi:hypothetical protein